jgi:arsenate reductase
MRTIAHIDSCGVWMDHLQKATLLVTMGCGDACPYVPGLRKLDWPRPDPKGQPIEIVRQIRDELRARVTALAEERGWL